MYNSTHYMLYKHFITEMIEAWLIKTPADGLEHDNIKRNTHQPTEDASTTSCVFDKYQILCWGSFSETTYDINVPSFSSSSSSSQLL